MFSKKDLDTHLFYQKYNYKIILEKEQKHGHVILYKLFLQELEAVKRDFDLYLVKEFFEASLAPYFSLAFFVKKSNRRI